MMKFIYSLCSLALFSFSVVTHADNISYHDDYKTLLTKYVTESHKEEIKLTLVDYSAWGQDPLHKQVLSAFLNAQPNKLSGKEKMVFWINAYNFLTIDLIIKTKETESIRNQGSFFKNVWKSHDWRISGEKYTLDQIEHDILRPMGEPKIHVAINCASISCPDLLIEPYSVEKLDRQLTEQSKHFLKEPNKGVTVVDNELVVSKIFKWFAEDFGGDAGVEKFIWQHLPSTEGKKIDDYLDYNWNLNSSL